MNVLSPTPHYAATVYGAASATPSGAPDDDPGWVKLASVADATGLQAFKFATNETRFRHYLLWITQLPPGGDSVEVGEITLYR